MSNRRQAEITSHQPRYPALYQANTRVWMRRIGDDLRRAVTLDDIPDSTLQGLADLGFDWLYLLGVWETGEAGRRVSLSSREWREDFENTLDDLTGDDICGSCFAVTAYTVDARLGGDAALRRLRRRMADQGVRLMLDFVPNHTALDHAWVAEHPDYYRTGTPQDLAREPQNFVRIGEQVFAYGRDPHATGWPDTLQLDYGNPAVHDAMREELTRIAECCDGVRCDMAMLILPEVFQRTWGVTAPPFWPDAITGIRQAHPDFTFLAEVYWDLEGTLQQQDFDYTYDKRLYGRLRAQQARPVHDHLLADVDYQDHLARFMENHDELRAAAVFPPEVYPAAAIITFMTPGLRFVHQGQLEGWTKRISPHLCRGPREATNQTLTRFWGDLLGILGLPALRDGQWQLLDCVPTRAEESDSFVAFQWRDGDDRRIIVVVNFGPAWGRCHVRLTDAGLAGRNWPMTDLLTGAVHDQSGDDLVAFGLSVERPGWGSHVLAFAGPG